MAPSVSSPSYQLLESWARRASAHHGAVASAAPAMRFRCRRRRFLASVRGQRKAATPCHQRKQRAYLKTRGPKVGHLRANGFTGSIVPATGLRAKRPFGAPNSLSLAQCAATPEPNSAFVHRKSVPSTHIRCKITPILRASATLARFNPRRFATSIPQRFSAEKRVTRERRMSTYDFQA